jgi:hypothetical protein
MYSSVGKVVMPWSGKKHGKYLSHIPKRGMLENWKDEIFSD